MTEIDLDKKPPVLFNGGPTGTVLLNYSFNISLYSLDMSTPQQKEAVIAIFDEYAALYGTSLNWTTNPVSGKFKHIRGKVDSYVLPGEWLMEEPQENDYDFLYHGGKKEWDSSDVDFMAKGSVRSNRLSIISCRFPIADVRKGKLNLPELMRRWCALLKPYHARGGYSGGCWHMTDDFYPMMYSTIEERLVDQLMFYPGLQYDGNNVELYYDKREVVLREGLRDGPRCADWLIALSDSFLEKLGGLDAVTDAMRPCPVLPYEGGAVLQAGDAPGLGKDGDPASLPDYLHLARVIEPVRSKCRNTIDVKWGARFSEEK